MSMIADRVGITGTRKGATGRQIISLAEVLAHMGAKELHHGDCVGADEQSHNLARALRMSVIIHPPIKPDFRAFCGWRYIIEMDSAVMEDKVLILPEDNYLSRNRSIVGSTEVTIAMPDGIELKRHGGTRYTADYAREMSRPLVLIWPNGHVTYERWGW
jgi:hypothetical protein